MAFSHLKSLPRILISLQFINTVTPHPSYVPREIAEDTTEICSVPTTLYHDSKRIIFVDTPGITDNRPVTHIVQDLRKFGR